MMVMPSVQGIDHRLLATLLALGDYLRDVVVVGGWVPHLYRAIWPSESPVEARRTFDPVSYTHLTLPTILLV